MLPLGLNEIRRKFLEFFESKSHIILPSAPLIPKDDNSVLLINAGMAPLKKYFQGIDKLPGNRAASCQKCIRTPDIENVGKTARHGTYFEMLGNFSFGDYFKKDAISFAYEFLTDVLKIPSEKLFVTVFGGDTALQMPPDTEAEEIWNKVIGIPKERIFRLGKKDNFWEHGAGPCGPCSEIHFDYGEGVGCGSPNCSVECDCDRYVEIWNLVFTQFDSDGKGKYALLSSKNIDTGMGLERLACVLQNAPNLFEVDTVSNIMKCVCEITGKNYHDNEKDDIALRILTDHTRSSVFMISDGVRPSGEGRGYVLRRLLRRAARYGRILGVKEPFIYKIAKQVIVENKEFYPEVIEKAEYIQKTIFLEEENFLKNIENGLSILEEITTKMAARLCETGEELARHAVRDKDKLPLKDAGLDAWLEFFRNAHTPIDFSGVIKACHNEPFSFVDFVNEIRLVIAKSEIDYETLFNLIKKRLTLASEDVFRLHDTYGFPLDLTREICEEKGLSVDEEEFRILMQKQKETARKNANFKGGWDGDSSEFAEVEKEFKKYSTQFIGYEKLKCETKIISLYQAETVVYVLLEKTPFYAESGGQVGDTGKIYNENSTGFVIYSQKLKSGQHYLIVTIDSGDFTVGDSVIAEVNSKKRLATAKNHTAVHLLQAALKEKLGQHIEQAGSYVDSEKFRFDFSHFSALSNEEIQYIEEIVNEKILSSLEVLTEELPIEEARKRGAIALFGEKYGEVVRLVSVLENENNFSIEFCGGTHIKNTSAIGVFHIVSETAAAAGIRRIEGVTSGGVLSLLHKKNNYIKNISGILKTNSDNLEQKCISIVEENISLRKEIDKNSKASCLNTLSSALKTEKIASTTLFTAILPSQSADDLRLAADTFEPSKIGTENFVVVLIGEKNILVRCGSEAIKSGATGDFGLKAGELIKAACYATGAKGGGKEKMAMGGIGDRSKIQEAIASVKEIINGKN